MLADIGINLTSSRFAHDREAVVQRAIGQQVERLLITGTNLHESQEAAALADEFQPWCFATAGVHPHEASSLDENGMTLLRQLLKHPRVLAVGETGLDFNRNYSPPTAQEQAFEWQLELAEETGMPLFLHERDAAERMLAILRGNRNSWQSGVIHCFTGDRDTLFAYLDLGLYVGITGWVCDERRGEALQELVPAIPADRLLLETDGPYLLPRTLPSPPKDKRNEPAYLPHIAETVAALRGESVSNLAAHTFANAKALFGW